MESPTKQPKVVPYRPRRSALNWVDFLVIAVTVVVFAAVVVANNPHARARTRATLLSTELPVQTSQVSGELSLTKAKVRLAIGGPWS